MTDQYWKCSASELAKRIRDKEVSSREAVLSCLARIDEVNPRLNAVVSVQADAALAAADRADRAVAVGEPLGILHGVPITTKVNVDQEGLPTTNGVAAFAGNVAAMDSPVVANFRKAGAVIVGRTNAPPFSLRWDTDNQLYGRTLNPWSPGHTPGGSSGGASASVAAGITPIAHGNDLAGSISYPAYCTGVVGLRPSHGRVPAFNPSAKKERPLFMQLMSVQGPLARDVADIRLALAAMSKADIRDPFWIPAPLEGPPLSTPCKVGLCVDPTRTGVHPDVEAALKMAARSLEAAGYAVEEAEPPDMAAIAHDWHVAYRAEARRYLLDDIAQFGDADVCKTVQWHILDFPAPTPGEYMDALMRRAGWMRKWNEHLRRFPLVLCPVSLAPPFRHGADVASRESLIEIVRTQAPCFAVPVLGLPAISVPTGVMNGLPIGVQLIGGRFREDLLLEAASAIQWHCQAVTPIDPKP